MIRRDYFLRAVQEMTQTLVRVVFLKQREEYSQAMQEIGAALRKFRDAPADDTRELSLEAWLELCRRHEGAASGLLLGLADLLREQGELFSMQSRSDQAQGARVVALGLFLEALLRGEAFVSKELMFKVEELIAQCAAGPMPASLRVRLVRYYEARGRFGAMEDVLFDWRDSGEPGAAEAGAEFYDRLCAKSDAELERGGLPRTEVEEGRRELLKKQS
jgi:Family of unknown function (DUF6483)